MSTEQSLRMDLSRKDRELIENIWIHFARNRKQVQGDWALRLLKGFQALEGKALTRIRATVSVALHLNLNHFRTTAGLTIQPVALTQDFTFKRKYLNFFFFAFRLFGDDKFIFKYAQLIHTNFHCWSSLKHRQSKTSTLRRSDKLKIWKLTKLCQLIA